MMQRSYCRICLFWIIQKLLRNNSGEIKRLPAVFLYGSIRKELRQETGRCVRRREDYDTEVLSDINGCLMATEIQVDRKDIRKVSVFRRTRDLVFLFVRRKEGMTLQEFFKEAPKAAVAFSGGADSAFLLWAAREYGADVRAYYVKTAFQPAFELKDARRLAQELQVSMTVIEEDILAVPEVAQNGPKRCYYCKRRYFPACGKPRARMDTRCFWTGPMPPMTRKTGRACRRCGASGAFASSGMRDHQGTAAQMSKEAGLFTWEKPAYACLATRVPTGTKITLEALKMWSGRKRSCQNLVLWISGCVSVRREQGSR